MGKRYNNEAENHQPLLGGGKGGRGGPRLSRIARFGDRRYDRSVRLRVIFETSAGCSAVDT
jgi:hypothetical protein